MKNTFNLKAIQRIAAIRRIAGIIAMVAAIGFSMAACDFEEDPEENGSILVPITITVTNITGYNGWEAWIALANNSGTVAYAMPLDITTDPSSKTFTMLRFDNDEPFSTAGTYEVVFWLKKAGEADRDYEFLTRSITAGSNTIAYTAFTPDYIISGEDKRADLEGMWVMEDGEDCEIWYWYDEDEGVYFINFRGSFDFPFGYWESMDFSVKSYNGSTVSYVYFDWEEEDDVVGTFTAQISNNKLIVSGFNYDGSYPHSAFDGTYILQEW